MLAWFGPRNPLRVRPPSNCPSSCPSSRRPAATRGGGEDRHSPAGAGASGARSRTVAHGTALNSHCPLLEMNRRAPAGRSPRAFVAAASWCLSPLSVCGPEDDLRARVRRSLVRELCGHGLEYVTLPGADG